MSELKPCIKCPRTAALIRRGLCNACYEMQRRRRTVYGTWDCQRTDATPALEHIAALTAAGMSIHGIAAAAGLHRATLQKVRGRTFLLKKTAEKVLNVPVPNDITTVATGGRRVSSHGSRTRVQALIAAGWTYSALAERLGMNPRNLWASVHRDTITVMVHNRVKALFSELQMQPGPSKQARELGAKRGWPLPLEWDEDAIDDPDAKPARARHSQRSVIRERVEQVTQLTDIGLSAATIADRLGVSQRQVTRDRRLKEAV